MVWRVVTHNGFSVESVQDFKTEDEALKYKEDYDRTHCHPYWAPPHPYWASVEYCNRDDVAYYSNS